MKRQRYFNHSMNIRIKEVIEQKLLSAVLFFPWIAKLDRWLRKI